MTEIDTLSEQARELPNPSFATMSASERTLIRLAKKMANEIERLRASHDALLEVLGGAITNCAHCGGTGQQYSHEDEIAVGCSPGQSNFPCEHCKNWRAAIAKAKANP